MSSHQLYASKEHTIDEICEAAGVSKATLLSIISNRYISLD